MISRKLQKYFDDYSVSHKTAGNQVSHYFGITLIVISLFGILSQFLFFQGELGPPIVFRLDFAVILILLAAVWYSILDWKMGLSFTMVLIGFYFIGRAIPFKANLCLFLVGWILQGIGHYFFEKKSPAFFQNLVHLMIGPLWIFAKVLGYR